METSSVDARSPTNSAAPLLLLLFMPAVAASVVLGVQLYLGGGVRYATMMMVASLALFIYAANGLSDSTEDAFNDIVRAAALRRHAVWTIAVSGAGIVVAGLLLALGGRDRQSATV